jgi:asparagine synthase (glutamine-hydrolysing)
MSSSDGRYSLTYNGEIYNFLELRDQLLALGHRFESESDTEVLLACYRQWGADGLLRCNGMWAIAIWDRREGQLFLSRDRFGKKPLFYAVVNGRLIFASEMKAIYPFLPRVEPSQDFAWMAGHIFDYEATDKCLVAGIKRFPAAHHGWWDGKTLTLRRYWNTLDHLEEVPQNYDDQVERFRELFVDSCRIRMRSDVPVGTALSGGLDSSATISAMAHIGKTHPGMRVSEDWQHAFVATFPGTPLDETRYARKVVEHIGIDATFVEIDPSRDIGRFDEIFYRFEELYITSPIPMLQTYEAVRAHGTRVTLDGHGADELLGGYPDAVLHATRDCPVWRLDELRRIHNACCCRPGCRSSRLFQNGRAGAQSLRNFPPDHPAHPAAQLRSLQHGQWGGDPDAADGSPAGQLCFLAAVEQQAAGRFHQAHPAGRRRAVHAARDRLSSGQDRFQQPDSGLDEGAVEGDVPGYPGIP